MSRVWSSSWSSRTIAQPSLPGRARSRVISSGCFSRAVSTTSRPSSRATTWYPSASSTKPSSSRISSLSSTTRMHLSVWSDGRSALMSSRSSYERSGHVQQDPGLTGTLAHPTGSQGGRAKTGAQREEAEQALLMAREDQRDGPLKNNGDGAYALGLAAEHELDALGAGVHQLQVAPALAKQQLRDLIPELVGDLERELLLVEIGHPDFADLGHRLQRPF